MGYKDKEKQKQYSQEYYSNPINAERNRETQKKIYAERKTQLIKYYIKKYCELADIPIQEYFTSFRKDWTFEVLKNNYKELKKFIKEFKK